MVLSLNYAIQKECLRPNYVKFYKKKKTSIAKTARPKKNGINIK